MAVSVAKRTRRKVTAPVVTPVTADIISIPREEETKDGENESTDPETPVDAEPPLTVESNPTIAPPIAPIEPVIIDLTGDTTEDEEEDTQCEPLVIAYNDFVGNASSSFHATPFHLMPLLTTTTETPGYNFEEVWQQSFDSMLSIQNDETPTSKKTKSDEEAVFRSTATRFANVLQGSFFVRPKKSFNGREIGDNHFEISSECNHQRGEFAATWEDGCLVMHPWDNNLYSQRGHINQFINNQTQPGTSATTATYTRRPSVFVPSTFASVMSAPPMVVTPVAPVVPIVQVTPVSRVPIPTKPERITRPNPFLFHANQGFPKRVIQ